MKNATFRQLRIFNEVAKQLSVTRAAQTMHLTAPAVSMQVKELEANIGMPLFERVGRTLRLTTPGEYMLVYTKKILSTLKDAEDAAARLQRLELGTLNIGMVSTAKYFLPRMLADFREDYDGIEIRLIVGNKENLIKMLRDNEVDIAIMGNPPSELATRAEPFAAHPHVFVAPPSHPLLRGETIQIEALQQQKFIIREPGSGTRAAFENFLKPHHFQPRIAMEMTSNETIKQAVMAGMGLSFLSLHTLGLELEHGLIAVLDVEGTPIVRAWNVVHTLSKMLSPAAEAFRYFMLEKAESQLAQQYGAYMPLPSRR
jgi:LysR family transcriptional regulator, low CO2-responsive transcriptional regulator